MNRYIYLGAVLMAVAALASCSTQRLASNSKYEDNVYYSQAKAGDQIIGEPTYTDDQVYAGDDDDYYYYDSYASRINRFNYASPFDYSDNYYYDYGPSDSTSYNTYAGVWPGYGYGFGPYGYFGYDPLFYGAYGFGLGYGYPYGGYYRYGYGGYSLWGGYGRGHGITPRPVRGTGMPANAMVARNIGYRGAYPISARYPGRPVSAMRPSYVSANGGRLPVFGQGRQGGRTLPVYQPASRSFNTPSGGSGSSGGGGSSSSSGGSRPTRH